MAWSHVYSPADFLHAHMPLCNEKTAIFMPSYSDVTTQGSNYQNLLHLENLCDEAGNLTSLGDASLRHMWSSDAWVILHVFEERTKNDMYTSKAIQWMINTCHVIRCVHRPPLSGENIKRAQPSTCALWRVSRFSDHSLLNTGRKVCVRTLGSAHHGWTLPITAHLGACRTNRW